MNPTQSSLSEIGERITPAKNKQQSSEITKQARPSGLLPITEAQDLTYQRKSMTPGMNKKAFDKFLARDVCCSHCGTTDDTLIPQHRANRGMGGSKALDRPSNIIVLCSEANGLLESNSKFAELGRKFGWKLTRGQEPETTPVYMGDGWWLLDNDYNRTRIEYDTEYF